MLRVEQRAEQHLVHAHAVAPHEAHDRVARGHVAELGEGLEHEPARRHARTHIVHLHHLVPHAQRLRALAVVGVQQRLLAQRQPVGTDAQAVHQRSQHLLALGGQRRSLAQLVAVAQVALLEGHGVVAEGLHPVRQRVNVGRQLVALYHALQVLERGRDLTLALAQRQQHHVVLDQVARDAVLEHELHEQDALQVLLQLIAPLHRHRKDRRVEQFRRVGECLADESDQSVGVCRTRDRVENVPPLLRE